MSAPIFTNNGDFASRIEAGARQDLMTLQADTSLPESDTTEIVSDPLLPDKLVTDRIGHMDPELYDLSDNSHLMRLLKALMGGAGAGGLRKQIAVARLQNSFRGMAFADLDRFYGALFGIKRTQAELMPDFGTLSSSSSNVQAQPATARYSLHGDSDFLNAVAAAPWATPYSMGEEFEIRTPALMQSMRYWRQTMGYVATQGAIYNVATSAVVPGTQTDFKDPPSVVPGWHTQNLTSPVLLNPGRYKIVVLYPAGYPYLDNFYSSGGPGSNSVTKGPIYTLSDSNATGGAESTFSIGTTLQFPTSPAGKSAGLGMDIVCTSLVDQVIPNDTAFNPYTDAAGSDVWDDVHSRDASYRDRLIKFAKALPLGGTYPGLRAAAEALLSIECEIYESWTWVDEQNASASQPPVLVYTWTSLGSTFPAWGDMTSGHTWNQLTGGQTAGAYFIGRTGQKNRGEVVIQPKRQVRPDEQYQMQRVISQLKPAGTQFTINSEGVAIHQAVPIRAVAADSEYWEIIYKTTPNPTLVSPEPAMPVYPQPDPKACQPRPCYSQYQGEKWCYNNDIVRCTSYKMISRAVVTATCYASLTFRDGYIRTYLTSHAVLDGGQVAASRIVSDGVLTSFAFAGRVTASAIKNAVFAKVGR